MRKDPPPPLPAGYVLGDAVWYTGMSEEFPSGDTLKYGEGAKVVGPSTEPDTTIGIMIRFPDHHEDTDVKLKDLSRDKPPPLPGGYMPMDVVYALEDVKLWDGREICKVPAILAGKVIGPGEGEQDENCVSVLYFVDGLNDPVDGKKVRAVLKVNRITKKAPGTDKRPCHHCGLRVARERCSRCKKAEYCSPACAQNAWKGGHKKTCIAAPISLDAKRSDIRAEVLRLKAKAESDELRAQVARLKAENARLLAWQQEAEEVEDI